VDRVRLLRADVCQQAADLLGIRQQMTTRKARNTVHGTRETDTPTKTM
jgi:hypothetical protein